MDIEEDLKSLDFYPQKFNRFMNPKLKSSLQNQPSLLQSNEILQSYNLKLYQNKWASPSNSQKKIQSQDQRRLSQSPSSPYLAWATKFLKESALSSQQVMQVCPLSELVQKQVHPKRKGSKREDSLINELTVKDLNKTEKKMSTASLSALRVLNDTSLSPVTPEEIKKRSRAFTLTQQKLKNIAMKQDIYMQQKIDISIIKPPKKNEVRVKQKGNLTIVRKTTKIN